MPPFSPLRPRGWRVVLAIVLGLSLTRCTSARPNTANPYAHPPPEWLTPWPTYPAVLDQDDRPTATPTVTPTPSPSPSPTPTATPSPTPTSVPTATPHPPVTLFALGNLFCRDGPGPYYDQVALLRPDDRAPILGYTPGFQDQRYWLIALPDARFCWLLDQPRFLEIQGDPQGLPTVPAPPPPELAFTITFSGLAECNNRYGWMFTVHNYGQLPIESVQLHYDQGADGIWPTYLDWWRDCQTRGGGPFILPGRQGLLTLDVASPGRGRTITMTARVCAKDHGQPPCHEKTFTFRP